MHADRGGQPPESAGRGQTAVLGIVLLIGMVAIVSVSMLLVASGTLTETEGDAEQEQVEQAFVELSHGIASATTDGDVSQSLELDAGEHGAIAHHDSATYNITAGPNENETRTIANGTIGTIEYESDDGTRIAYEGGGVFKETGSETEILSTPPSEYDHGTNTLSFPVVTLAEDKMISSGDVQVSRENVTPEAMNYVEDDNVYIELESDYCKGWEQHFTEQSGEAAVQKSCDDNNGGYTLQVRLGYEEMSNAFSSGLTLSNTEMGGQDNHNPFTPGEPTEFPPIDGVIDQMVEEFEESSDVKNTSENSGGFKEGDYYSDGISNEELNFNLSNGDAMLVVNGTIDTSDAKINVSDCDNGSNQLRIYTTGDLSMHGGTITSTCESIETVQLYGQSDMGIHFQSHGEFRGLIYAASDKQPGEDGFDGWSVEEAPSNGNGNGDNRNPDYQIHLQGVSGEGGFDFNGSVIANSIKVGSQADNGNSDINTVSLEDSDITVLPEGYEPAPQLTYLNLVQHEIEIENT